MTNPTRSIHSHGNFHKLLPLLFLTIYSAAPSATAQMSTNSSPSSGSSSSGFNPSITIIVVVIFGSFCIMLFFSVCIRRSNPNPAIAVLQRPSKPGLDPQVINTFPTFHYSDVRDFKFGKGRGTLECAVCIAEFVNDDAMRLLPKCDHVFHPVCIDAWLASHSTCPVCRADLTPSKNDLKQVTVSTRPNDLDHRAENQNQNRSQIQNQDQIAVDVEEGGNREVQASELQKSKLVLRSHSTGHSLSHPGEDLESSRKGGGGGEERSGRGRLDQRWRSDRWVLPKVGFEGDLTAVNRSFLTTVRTPFECLAVKRDGVGQTSTRPLV